MPTNTNFTDYDGPTLDSIASVLARTSFHGQDVVQLLATLDGAKPGVSLTTSVYDVGDPTPAEAWARTHPVAQLCDALGVPYSVHMGGDETDDSRFLNIEVAHDRDHLQYAPPYETPDGEVTLPEGHPEHMRDWGRFIGVPEPDNCWWQADEWDTTESGGWDTDVMPLCEYTGREVTGDELRAVSQLSYIPEPTVDGIDRAVALGQQFYRACWRFDREQRKRGTSWAVSATDYAEEYAHATGTYVAVPVERKRLP